MTPDAKPSPITEDDLHAWVDGQLDPARADALGAYLADHPEQARRVQAWQAQRLALRARFAGVLDEPIPERLRQAASPPRTARASQGLWRLAASLLIALAGGVLGWGLRAQWPQPTLLASAAPANAGAFALRAAVAHTVFVPDLRRPVEISADHEDQLVTWLSKRMGARLTPPRLQALGYRLQGGRLLPGGQGPVAQFMYEDAAGMRLTLYVTNEDTATAARGAPTTFQFTHDGPVNVFYWIEDGFGYALSSYAGRSELARISAEVYRQLNPGQSPALSGDATPG